MAAWTISIYGWAPGWLSHPGKARGPRNIEEISLVRAYTLNGDSVSLLQLLRPIQSESAVVISHRDGDRALTVLAIILVMGVLVIVFDSFHQGFIIVFTMPLALTGTFIGFFVFGLEFSFFSMRSVISLVGSVVNNGIMMVDTMNRSLMEGGTIAVAAASGSARRLQPILTTSLTTIMGLMPLAISSPMCRPLTLVIIFGLISATMLSLFVVPALYLPLTSKSHKYQTGPD